MTRLFPVIIMALILGLALANSDGPKNILVVGDSFALHLGSDGMGKPILEELESQGHTVRIVCRNTGTDCGMEGGSLFAIGHSLECLDFEWADVVVLLAGYHDGGYPRFCPEPGGREKSVRAERAAVIEKYWQKHKKARARFIWADSRDLAFHDAEEDFVFDSAGHYNTKGYWHIFSEIGLVDAPYPTTRIARSK